MKSLTVGMNDVGDAGRCAIQGGQRFEHYQNVGYLIRGLLGVIQP